jgi:hypothetical protein
MNEDLNKEELRYAGLTTAALAGAGEPAALKKANGAPAGMSTTTAPDERETPLFTADEAKEFRVRWDTIQGSFVDEPRSAVKQADSLVAGTMKRLAEIFADERAKLEAKLDREESVSTEDLRLALRRYRSFFGRLLSV